MGGKSAHGGTFKNKEIHSRRLDIWESIYDDAGLMSDVEGQPADSPHGNFYKPYRPLLNPIQGECYDGIKTHLFNFIWGERYSGKTFGGIHALVDHCRENANARALIIVLTKRQGEEGGVWHKLCTSIRREWEEGGNAVFTEPRVNAIKDVSMWVSNKYGGWSRIVLVSMPVESSIADRVKGTEWTFILLDEAQVLQSPTYFTAIVQQVGRDPNIPHQPVVYCANPAGQSHWLYERFFKIPMEHGQWNPLYFVKHVPLSDNLHNVPKNYIDMLVEATRNDPIEFRRMVGGEWVDPMAGDALFRDDFHEELVMRGDPLHGIGLLPMKNFPVVVGWDIGAAHTSLQLQNYLPTKDGIAWSVFDEMNYVDQYIPFPTLVPHVLRRMEYWKTMVGSDLPFVHVSDNSAFNQFRARDGSFDAKDIEDLSGGKIKLIECPKGNGSVEARVRITKEQLGKEALLLSAATCPRTKEMFLNLEEDPKARMKPKRSRFLHSFDSLTYPQLYYHSGGVFLRPRIGAVHPMCYSVAR